MSVLWSVLDQRFVVLCSTDQRYRVLSLTVQRCKMLSLTVVEFDGTASLTVQRYRILSQERSRWKLRQKQKIRHAFGFISLFCHAVC